MNRTRMRTNRTTTMKGTSRAKGMRRVTCRSSMKRRKTKERQRGPCWSAGWRQQSVVRHGQGSGDPWSLSLNLDDSVPWKRSRDVVRTHCELEW